MLDSVSRGAIVALSGLCVVGAVALGPARARSSIVETSPAAIAMTALPPQATSIPVQRDPFGEPAAAATDTAQYPAAPVQPLNVRTAVARNPATLDALPSNLTTDVIPAIPGSTAATISTGARVTAIVTGAHPYAMVEMNGAGEIKGIGDVIANVPIVAIDIAGVRLADGQRLSIDPADRP